ncbi:MAG: hypothetical protein WAQ05_06050 [Rubrivivax sp.]
MERFKTLLLREWMQHRFGWLVLLAIPLLVIVGAGLFGQLHMELNDDGVVSDSAPPLAIALATLMGVGGLSLVLAWGAALLQSPGLARRDVQDRSVEFWLSLPVSHTQSISATLLAHLVLWPWAALLVGMAGGLLGSLLVITKGFGLGAWFGLPWAQLLPAVAVLALRLMLGLLLATLWLAPLILGTMAASAWLKRWGVPVVVGGIVGGGLVLERVYGNPIVWDLLRSLGLHASQALMAVDRSGNGPKGLVIHDDADIGGALGLIPGWLLHDAGQALLLLASPAFVASLLLGALAFGGLWLRRARGA